MPHSAPQSHARLFPVPNTHAPFPPPGLFCACSNEPRQGVELKTLSPGHERTPHAFAHARGRERRRRRFAESHVYSSFIKGREGEALAPLARRRSDACAFLPPRTGACSLNALHWRLPRKWKEESPKRAGSGGSRKKDGGNGGGRARPGPGR